jgi:hypothetical protein
VARDESIAIFKLGQAGAGHGKGQKEELGAGGRWARFRMEPGAAKQPGGQAE